MVVLAESWFDTGWRDDEWLNRWEIPFGRWVEESIDWLNVHGDRVFAVIEWPFKNLLDLITKDILLNIPWPFMLLAFVVLGFLVRDVKVGLGAAAGIFLCGVLGPDYWRFTMQTIGIILVAVIICVVVGLPYGVLCARSDRVWNITRPFLDGMQLVHAFTYLIAIIFFFGTGPVGGTIATMIFALPPMIRLTNLGIRQVPDDVIEAARAYGASNFRVLTDVQLPLARPAIMTGVNQVLLLALSFVGIIAVIAGGGLGQLVLRGVNTSDPALGAASGLALYLVGVVMDRLSQPDPSDNRTLIRRMGTAVRGIYTVPAVPSAAPAGDDTPVVTRPPRLRLKPTMTVAGGFGLVGGMLAILSAFLTWVKGAGRLSSYARPDDQAINGTFSGIEATGGSWFGTIVLITGVLVVLLSMLVLLRIRDRWSSWLNAPSGLLLTGVVLIGMMAIYLSIDPHDLAGATSHGSGVFLAIVAGAILLLGGLLAWRDYLPAGRMLRAAPVGLLVGIAAVGLLVIGSFANWVNDERPGAFTPEQQQLIDRERANPSPGGVSASLIAQVIGEAQEDPNRYDGFDDQGPAIGWGILGIAIALAAVVLLAAAVPRAGALWDVLTLGIGTAALFGVTAWVVSFLRVSVNGIFTGAGALPVLMACGLIMGTTIGRMRRRSLDEREAADAATVATPLGGAGMGVGS
ncbi:ABC transporter permease [Candidatus Poriferisocius sp.]|uniref:ABC transporter permease n=1 Tax=Candidatus Poriferisocius sp. TaxID=3101276 RepID=UPI003B017E53